VKDIVVVVGGFDGSRMTSVELLYPGTTSFVAGTSLPAGTSGPGTVVLGNKVVYVGGYVGSGPSNQCYMNDFSSSATGSWQSCSNLPASLNLVELVALNDDVAVSIGGFSDSGVTAPVTSVYKYVLSNNAWSSATGLSSARAGMGCALYFERVWCVGGKSASADVNTVESIDTSLQSWRTEASVPTASSRYRYVGMFQSLHIKN
jgi:hypothetical protein